MTVYGSSPGAQREEAAGSLPAGDLQQPRGAAQQHPAPAGGGEAAPCSDQTPREADLLQHQGEPRRLAFEPPQRSTVLWFDVEVQQKMKRVR